MSKKLKILLYTLGILIAMQFIGIDKTVPQLEGRLDFIEIETPPKDIARLIKKACYDCHSYETVFPSYSNYAPISWVIGNHVQEGRKHLNFSTWGNYKEVVRKDLLLKSYKQIGARLMPPFGYVKFHKEAKIQNDQLEKFYVWFKKQSQKYSKL